MSPRTIVFVLVLLATACSRERAPATGAAAPEAPARASSALPTTAPGTAPDAPRSRDVVRTAEVRLRAAHPTEVVEDARRWVEANEGFVGASSTTRAGTRSTTSRATLRMPSARYREALRHLRALATVLEIQEQGEDVSAVRADGEARIAAKRTLEQRLLALAEHTGSVDELIRVENELGRVRADIESMEATNRALLDRVSFATIELVVESPEQPLVARAESFGSRLQRSATHGLQTAEAIVTGLAGLVVALSPLAVLALVGLGAWRFARRASRRVTAG